MKTNMPAPPCALQDNGEMSQCPTDSPQQETVTEGQPSEQGILDPGPSCLILPLRWHKVCGGGTMQNKKFHFQLEKLSVFKDAVPEHKKAMHSGHKGLASSCVWPGQQAGKAPGISASRPDFHFLSGTVQMSWEAASRLETQSKVHEGPHD